MKITKDTKVSVDVRKCSLKEKRLVITYFDKLTDMSSSNIEAAVTKAKVVSLNYSLPWSYSSIGDLHNPTVISFNKFLKSVNPYKGESYIIEDADEKVVRRIKKMGYRNRYTVTAGTLVVVRIERDGWYFEHNHEAYESNPHLTRKQFMNLELPELKFKEWDVVDNGKTISVGCRTFHKRTILRLYERLLDLKQYATPNEVYDFIEANKDKLNIK